MFNIEQSQKQPVPTGFSIVQANYVNLTSASDKQLIVYIQIAFDDGSTRDDQVTFSGLDYNSANTAFATWGGIIAVIESKLGIKLTIPENIEETFQNVPPPPPVEEKPESMVDDEAVVPSNEPVPLPAESTDAPIE